MNNFGLFFTRDSMVLRLPVNPEKLPVARGSENEDYNVLGLGPIQVPRIPSLQVIRISSFFPGRPFPGVLTSGGFEEPELYISFFQSAMQDRVPILYTPVRYYEDGTPFLTSDAGFRVLVTRFDTEERGGETGDFYYDLELTEYRDYSPATFTIQAPAAPQQPAVANAEPAREIPAGQLAVGSICIANGNWYYSSYGDEPHGTGSGRRVVVSRIADASRKCPIHVNAEGGGPLGWMSRESLQVQSAGGTYTPAVTSTAQQTSRQKAKRPAPEKNQAVGKAKVQNPGKHPTAGSARTFGNGGRDA